MLKIKNPDKMVGQMFVRSRYICTRSEDSITHWRFQFEDLNVPVKKWIWVEVDKVGRWDNEEQKWMHQLNYPNCPTHRVSLDYFGQFKNAIYTFETALKEVQ